ncbi:hydroxymethylbilane synthase, partial [Nocardia sp. NPDC058497]
SLLGVLWGGAPARWGASAAGVVSIDADGRVFEELSLRACAAAIDGSDVLRASIVGAPRDAEELGRALARDLLDLGARALMSVADEPEPEVGSPTQAVNTPAPDFTNSSPMENNR